MNWREQILSKNIKQTGIFKELTLKKMNTTYTQQIIDTMDEILTVIKQAGHRTNDLKKHQQNAERHNNLKMVKYYTHQIDICDLATIRLKQRLKRQAEEIISLISLNIIPDLNK